MDLAVAILVQVVNWPLAVVVLLSTGAIAAWDPASATPLSRTAIAVTNLTLAALFAI